MRSLTKMIIRIITAVVLVFLSLCVAAHELKPAIVDLNYETKSEETKSGENRLRIDMIVNLESLMTDIGPDHDNTDDSENSDEYKQLRELEENELLHEFTGFQTQFLSNIKVLDAKGTRLNLSVLKIDIPPTGSTDIARDTKIILHSAPTDEPAAVSWQWDAAFGEVIVRANSDSHAIDYATLLAPGQTTELIQFTQENNQSVIGVITNYVKLGFVHILPKGLDHILFVLGLFLLSTQWRSLLAQVTTFTIAHSITLALGATKMLSVSSSIVEPLIALSIVFVCVENIFVNNLGKWRLATVFVFGLLHGLGFSSVLDEIGVSSTSFISALFGFNLGVEIGQLAIIAVCLLLVGLWFGKKSWYRPYFSKPASVVIGLVGLFWFAQRTML